MNRALMMALFVAPGCQVKDTQTDTTDTTDTTTAETGTSPTDSADTGETDTPEPDPVITKASATCGKGDLLTLYVETNGWVSGALMLMQETGNVEPQYNEAQPIDSYYADVPGDLEKMKSTLATGTKFVSRVSTQFTCANHIAAKGVMSYIVVVFDQDAVTPTPVDCFAFGEDPQGLIAGKYTGTSSPPQPILDMIDQGKCTIGTNVTTPL